jgi:UDP-N-acetylmuramoylalanine-D-glutamate ligase
MKFLIDYITHKFTNNPLKRNNNLNLKNTKIHCKNYSLFKDDKMIRDTKILVIGAGNAGRPAAQLLNYVGNEIRLIDQKSYSELPQKARNQLENLESSGITLELGEDPNKSIKWAESVFISPNIPDNAVIRELVRKEQKNRDLKEINTTDIGRILNSLIKMPIVGVAGTDGKTTTTNMIFHCFNKAYNPLLFSSLQDSLVIEGLIRLIVYENETDFDVAVLELPHGTIRMTEGLEIAVGVVTNLTPDHMEEFDSYSDYIQRNLSIKDLLHENGILVVNGDDPILSQAELEDYETIYYGLNSPKTIDYNGEVYKNTGEIEFNVVADQIKDKGMSGSEFRVKVFRIPTLICENCNKKNCDCGDFKRKYVEDLTATIKISLPSTFNIENTLATIATTLAWGYDMETAKACVESFTSLKGRFEKIGTVNNVDVYMDAAHNPDSIDMLLNSLKVEGRLIVSLDNPDTLTIRDKSKIGQILGEYADILLVSAKNETTKMIDTNAAEEVLRGANLSEEYLTLDVEESVQKALKIAVKGDLIIHIGPGVVNEYQNVKNDILRALSHA